MRLGRLRLDRRDGVLVGWVAAIAATQAWRPWGDQISQGYGSDVTSYRVITEAAPSLPHTVIASHHAERFASHWLVGTVANEAHVNAHAVYRVATAVSVLALLLVLHRVFVRLGLSTGTYAVCLGLVAASAYPVRYLLAAPGMLEDAVFLLGLAVALLGAIDERPATLLGGVALATLGRQTAVPAAVVLACVIALRRPRTPRRLALAGGVAALSVGIFAAEWLVTRGFSKSEIGALSTFTVLSSFAHPVELADHVGRVALGCMVGLAFAAGAWLRRRRDLPLAPALAAVAVAGQAVVLGPEWAAHNEPRLAGLAAPAFAVTAAWLLRDVKLEPRVALLGCAGLFLASLHARYTNVGIPSSAIWVALETCVAAGLFVLAWRIPGTPAPVTAGVETGFAAEPRVP